MELIFRYRPIAFGGPGRLVMTVYGGSSPLIDCEARPLPPDEGDGSWVEITSRLPSKAGMTAYVAHHEGETLEDTYRRADCSDETAYPVPVELVDRLEAAQSALDRAVEAIREYIAEHDAQETELGHDVDTRLT